MQHARAYALSACLLIGAAACGGDGKPPIALDGKTNDHGTGEVTSEGRLELELGDFFFGPTFVRATAGKSVTVDLHNEGDAAHSFTLDTPKVDVVVEAGQRGVTAFGLPPGAGPVRFYCRFHVTQGMQGAFFFSSE